VELESYFLFLQLRNKLKTPSSLHLRPHTRRIFASSFSTGPPGDRVSHFSASRGFSWRMHCGVEVTESSTNKQHSSFLPLECHRNSTTRTRSVFAVRPYHCLLPELEDQSRTSSCQGASLRINLILSTLNCIKVTPTNVVRVGRGG
jgi:hypothetical protein